MFKRIFFLLIFVFFTTPLLAANSVQLMFGAPYNTISPLKISQQDQPDISVKADFTSKPVNLPPYYSLRIATTSSARSWELELLHHKLYMTSSHADIQKFEATHGFNYLMLNHAWHVQPLTLRIGLGSVVTHPENTVRNQSLDENKGIAGSGYYLSGVSGQLSMSWSHEFTRHWYATAEGKITYAWVIIPVAKGDAELLHGAIHGLAGFGYQW